MKTKSYMRYHRYDQNNVKYIKRFELNETIPIADVGFTDWNRGTGPHSAETLHNLTIALQKACKGVPKSKETKEKMRQAKLGKPKSEQHKLNMKLSHQRRRNNDATRTTQQKQLTS